MSYIKNALIYLLVFLAGCLFAALIVITTNKNTDIETVAGFSTDISESKETESQETEANASAEDHPVQQKVSEIQELIDTYFVGEYDDEEMADYVADAMVTATGDRWSYYISADDVAAYEEQMANAYVGIGVTITKSDENTITITQVASGGPALKAGVQAGDILSAVNGESVAGMTTTEVRDIVRGEEGTNVQITVLRNGEEISFDIIRAQIETVVASWEMIDNSIAYIRIENFEENCADAVISCIKEAVAQNAESLLFDVRFNPGGYKRELVEVLDYLLPEGPLFTMKTYAGETYTDYSDADCIDLPMAVLINADSYSAAEFFAAALQEYEAAVVVGDQTCGKGYFQYTYYLSDGSAVALSSGTYYTPDGISLIGTGVTPDCEISLSDEELLMLYQGQLPYEEDDQLQSAVSLLNK